MEKTTQKQILIVSAIVFLLSSGIPGCVGGCLHHATVSFGLPFPWFALNLKYGAPRPEGNFFAHGPIERIEDFQLHWTMLPLALGAALAVGVVVVGSARSIAGLFKLFKKHDGKNIIKSSAGSNAAPLDR